MLLKLRGCKLLMWAQRASFMMKKVAYKGQDIKIPPIICFPVTAFSKCQTVGLVLKAKVKA